MSKNSKLIIGVVAAAVLIAAGWYLASPLFIDNSVDEAFPFDLPDTAALAAMDSDEMADLEADFMAAVPDEETVAQLSEEDRQIVTDEVMEAAAAVMADKETAEEMPAAEAEWVVAASGTFVGADNFHQGEGTATIFQQGDQRVLRFEEFSVTNGPDLRVLLSTSPNPTSRSDLGDYIDLGSLKGNMGNQNYEIPADVDLSQYQSVVIYCQPFHVLFSSASLDG